ncbi:UBA/TS-N domain containing protein, putative [Hepatocystis sp. ex Piliocolobus tephrosceles]|nr:UBA/TS-N domain containing protein, putative [Hepatocystis sp. ex Piliocolobus tephrosceles]
MGEENKKQLANKRNEQNDLNLISNKHFNNVLRPDGGNKSIPEIYAHINTNFSTQKNSINGNINSSNIFNEFMLNLNANMQKSVPPPNPNLANNMFHNLNIFKHKKNTPNNMYKNMDKTISNAETSTSINNTTPTPAPLFHPTTFATHTSCTNYNNNSDNKIVDNLNVNHTKDVITYMNNQSITTNDSVMKNDNHKKYENIKKGHPFSNNKIIENLTQPIISTNNGSTNNQDSLDDKELKNNHFKNNNTNINNSQFNTDNANNTNNTHINEQQHLYRELYSEQLKSLNLMGFSDTQKCIKALIDTNGNIDKALDLLLNDMNLNEQ